MEMSALALAISTTDTPDEGVERCDSDLRLAPSADDPGSVIGRQIFRVLFPVLFPSEDGRVMPFGRYDLAAFHQSGSTDETSAQAVLVSRDNGARTILSVRESTAIARDPEVDIVCNMHHNTELCYRP